MYIYIIICNICVLLVLGNDEISWKNTNGARFYDFEVLVAVIVKIIGVNVVIKYSLDTYPQQGSTLALKNTTFLL